MDNPFIKWERTDIKCSAWWEVEFTHMVLVPQLKLFLTEVEGVV